MDKKRSQFYNIFRTSESYFEPQDFKGALLKIKNEIDSSKAVIFGKPKDEKYMDEYINIFLELFKKPVIFNMNFGHTAPVYILPYGGIATLFPGTEKVIIKK